MSNLDPQNNMDLNFDGEASLDEVNQELHIPIKTRDKTCEERIDEALFDREEYLEMAFKVIDGDYLDDEDENDKEILEYIEQNDLNEDSINELPLGVEKNTIIKIELSTGGPADYIEAFVDNDGSVYKVMYHYQDWFDGAEKRVSQDSPMFRFAEYFAEIL